MAAGVPVAFGTDTGISNHGKNAEELELLVEYGGMDPAQALQTATYHAARLLRMQNRIGSIEAGKLADLIAVGKSPLENIKVMTKIQMVMKDGVVYKQ